MPGGISGLYPSLTKQRKAEAKKKIKEEKMKEEVLDERFELIDTGGELINKILKRIKSPADKNSYKEITEGVKLLSKKSKLMKKDDALKAQYLDRTAFDTIQGVFQVLHLYIISTNEMAFVDDSVEWLRSHENCYSIAARMQKAALARADFSGGKKR